MRSFAGGLVVGLSLLVGGCSSTVSLQSEPQDQRAARDLANTVADKANCPGFEDYRNAKGHWDFTCQKSNRTFTIRIFANAAARDSSIKELAASGTPYKTGRFFIVYHFSPQGQSNTPAELADFPGDPGAQANERGRS